MSKTIYHNHHIIPKHVLRKLDLPDNWMGEDNLIKLTPKEHCMAHYDRWLRYGNKDDLDATKMLDKLPWDIDYSGENCSWYGKKHTPETKRKISEANKGKKHTEEHRHNNSKAQMGNTNAVGNTNWLGKSHTPETIEKMRETHTGKKYPNRKSRGPCTEETKMKISVVRKGNVPWNKGMKKVNGKYIKKEIT